MRVFTGDKGSGMGGSIAGVSPRLPTRGARSIGSGRSPPPNGTVAYTNFPDTTGIRQAQALHDLIEAAMV